MKNNVQLLHGEKKAANQIDFTSCHVTHLLGLLSNFEGEDCCGLRRQAKEETAHKATCDDDVLLHKFCSLWTKERKTCLYYDFTTNYA